MKISFNLPYHTHWGESIYLCGSPSHLGDNDPVKALPLTLVGQDLWNLEIESETLPEEFTYFYIVKPEEGEWRFEWGKPHQFRCQGVKECLVRDSWREMPADKPYYSSAIVNGIMRRAPRMQPLETRPGHVRIEVWAPMVAPSQVVCLAGETDHFGKWDPKQALRFNDAFYPCWQLDVPAETLRDGLECKLLLLDSATGEVAGWENRNNRHIDPVSIPADGYGVIAGWNMYGPVTDWKCAGTAIPVFSLRSEDDFGVGDFADLRLMADWCQLTGQKVLQILPINDTSLSGTWLDSYPYRANSTFALNPLFIRPEAAGSLRDPETRQEFQKLKEELNALADVDYERVTQAKERYMRQLYAETGEATAARPDFQAFEQHNAYWLKPYAVWNALRLHFGTPDNGQWGEYAEYTLEKADAYAEAHPEEVGYHYFVQYHLDRQLHEAVEYARTHGVVLKGDIPIGIGRHSVDAWLYPHLFNMNSQAGAPPDDFSVLGQNWGFPTYNWDEMARDGFAWWKARFIKMAEYFDAYRIDHVLGFFRIWQIPLDALHGLLGVFNPALPFSPEELRDRYDFWIQPHQTKPLIREWMLGDFFGEHVEEAKERFLRHDGEDRYRLRQFVDTQKKVADYFSTLEKDEKNNRLCNALLGLIDDVLFIEDPYEKGKYHPRIAAQHTYQYRILTDYEKWSFNRLYTDFFYHRHNDFWYGKAMWKLPPLLDSTSMLTCAEDLGMIPDCVASVMHRLQILSLEIQRMPKNPEVAFGQPWNYPYYSVCTTSTHDMSGIRGWWEEDRDATQRFYNEVLHEHGAAPAYAEPWICDKIVDQHLYSPSMLCVLPLQDWLSIDGAIRRQNPQEEQINVPANPTHYWKYRMHLPLETLLRESVFNEVVKEKVKTSGRG